MGLGVGGMDKTTPSFVPLHNSRVQKETDTHREEQLERAALLSFPPHNREGED